MPGEESDDAARVAGFISKIEVIGARIVKIHGEFHEPQAQDATVEIQVALRIARYCGDVVYSKNVLIHYGFLSRRRNNRSRKLALRIVQPYILTDKSPGQTPG